MNFCAGRLSILECLALSWTMPSKNFNKRDKNEVDVISNSNTVEDINGQQLARNVQAQAITNPGEWEGRPGNIPTVATAAAVAPAAVTPVGQSHRKHKPSSDSLFHCHY